MCPACRVEPSTHKSLVCSTLDPFLSWGWQGSVTRCEPIHQSVQTLPTKRLLTTHTSHGLPAGSASIAPQHVHLGCTSSAPQLPLSPATAPARCTVSSTSQLTLRWPSTSPAPLTKTSMELKSKRWETTLRQGAPVPQCFKDKNLNTVADKDARSGSVFHLADGTARC